MNKFYIPIFIGIFLFIYNLQAQTNLNDNINISLKRGYNITPFFLLHNKDIGGGLSVSTINTNLIGYGAAFALIQENHQLNFYNASVSLKLGYPIQLNKDTYIRVYLESGAAINIANPNTIYEQSIIGFSLSRTIFNGNILSLGGGIGNNSKWGNDRFYIGTISISF